MKKIVKLEIILILITIFFVGELFAQSPDRINQWIDQLKNKDWKVRSKAAFELNRLSPQLKTDQVKKALIDELNREYEKIKSGNYEYCDEGGEEDYYSWLFENVSNFKDERAFDLFVRIGSPTALVKYGDKGVMVIIDKINYDNFGNLFAALRALENTLRPNQDYVAQGPIKEMIKQVMIKAFKENREPEKGTEWFGIKASERSSIRIEVMRSLEYLAEEGDKEVIPIIISTAEEDPYYLDMSKETNYTGPQKRYVVREEAKKILVRLKTKGILK